MAQKTTVTTLQQMKHDQENISMITAYDYPTARLVDGVGIEIILVGDSVGNTTLGHADTVSVELDDIIHHAQAVMRAVERPFVVGDMPFMSFNVSPEQALRNAGRLMKEARVDSVKLEGGQEMAEIVHALVHRGGIPTMGHIGLTPQRISQMGGFKVQGKNVEAAQRLVDDAQALEQAGVFALVLEGIPHPIARVITERLSVPVIGIGAGPHCDGQVLVFHDVVGLSFGVSPKFVKQYADLAGEIETALERFKNEIKDESFPTVEEHSFDVDEDVVNKLS